MKQERQSRYNQFRLTQVVVEWRLVLKRHSDEESDGLLLSITLLHTFIDAYYTLQGSKGQNTGCGAMMR